MSSDTSSSRPPRKRIQFTRQQKQEIRDFYNSHPQCTAKVLRQWFEDKHGLPLRPSTISTILRSSDKSTGSNNVIRARLPKFPELENQLRQWVDQRMLRERDNVNFYITNEMLKTAAQDIWKSLQENNINKPDSGHLPSFSEGWIEKFKRRTNMPRLRRKSSISKSKSGSPTTMPVPVVPTAKRQESNITDNTTFNNTNKTPHITNTSSITNITLSLNLSSSLAPLTTLHLSPAKSSFHRHTSYSAAHRRLLW